MLQRVNSEKRQICFLKTYNFPLFYAKNGNLNTHLNVGYFNTSFLCIALYFHKTNLVGSTKFWLQCSLSNALWVKSMINWLAWVGPPIFHRDISRVKVWFSKWNLLKKLSPFRSLCPHGSALSGCPVCLAFASSLCQTSKK